MAWLAAMAKKISPVAQERPRGGAPRRMADMLPQIGGMAFRKFGFIQSSVITRWAEIVGDRYARVTAPESIRFPQGKREQGTLTITVVPAHAPMMQHVQPAIIERVNRFFGYAAVARIQLLQGEVKRAAPRPAPPEPCEISPELGESLKPIADPELRAVLEALARGVSAPPPIKLAGKIS